MTPRIQKNYSSIQTDWWASKLRMKEVSVNFLFSDMMSPAFKLGDQEVSLNLGLKRMDTC